MRLEPALDVIRWCRTLATLTETPGMTTRTFLSPPMRDVHTELSAWMTRIGMRVDVDAAGNLRGVYPSSSIASATAPRRLYLGSHLDTVPNAGAFDGVLGVVMAIAVVGLLDGRRLPFEIEVVGFSDEEGVRFGVPFIGSRALSTGLDEAILDRRDAAGQRLADVIRNYGLDPTRLEEARATEASLGYLEFHIEQGPILESLDHRLGIVDAIVGQSRYDATFDGMAGHAGTTPMSLRRDALTCASEWILVVEQHARTISGLAATVGSLDVEPGASNVIAGRSRATLDVRHRDDRVRHEAVRQLLASAEAIAVRRGVRFTSAPRLDQPAVSMDPELTARLCRAVDRCGYPVHSMSSGAGHDAMIVAGCMPTAMLFIRSPGGVSHHPDESVLVEDVAAALETGLMFLEDLARG